MVLERVRKCPLVYPVLSALYIPYVRCLYPMGEAPGGGVRLLSDAPPGDDSGASDAPPRDVTGVVMPDLGPGGYRVRATVTST